MSAVGTNLATAARARERRQAAVNSGQMSPHEAAMSAYNGPAWDAFFGSFQDQEEAGYTPRVNWSNFGNTVSEGSSMPRLRGSLGYGAGGGVDEGAFNPLELQAMRDQARARMGNADVEQARIEQAVQKDYTDAQQREVLGSLGADYERHLIGQAFAMPEEQTRVERGPDGVTARPVAQMGDRERQLRMAPPHLRPALLKQYAEMDAKAQMADAAMVKARADETTAQANLKRAESPADTSALVAVMGPNGQPVLVPKAQAVGMRPASSREQGRAVTSGDAGKLSDINEALKLTESLNFKQSDTGILPWLGGAAPDAVTNLTGFGLEAKQRQGVINLVKQIIGKGLEGGVLRKEDESKYEKILPTLSDPPDVVTAKIANMKRTMEQKRDVFIDALDDAGYDVGQFRSRQPSAASDGAAGMVPMVAPDGRPLMVPADKVAALEAAGAKKQ